MSDLFENHIVGFPMRWLNYDVSNTKFSSVSRNHSVFSQSLYAKSLCQVILLELDSLAMFCKCLSLFL